MKAPNSKVYSHSGEKEFLGEIAGLIHSDKNPRCWRDDCIIVPITQSKSLLYSIDRPPQIYMTGDIEHDIRCYGRWAASVVANDIIACGTNPSGIAFDIGAQEMDVAYIKTWVLGVLDVCKSYGMNYEGGNIGTGQGITGVAWGIQESGKVIRRSGAIDKGILISTGLLGTGWLIRLWQDSGRNMERIGDLRAYKDEPWINLEAFRKIWNTRAIRCGMDLTDGAIEFGYEILEQSGMGVLFEPEHCSQFHAEVLCKELDIPPKAVFFEPGYDTPFAHGWCIDPDKVGEVEQTLHDFHIPFTKLGRVDSSLGGVYVKTKTGDLQELPRYWDDAFKVRGSVEDWNRSIVPLFAE